MLVASGREASPLLSALGFVLAVGLVTLSVKMAQQFPHLTAFQWIIRLLGPLGYLPAVALLLFTLGVFGPEPIRLTAYPTFEYSQVLRMPQPLTFLSRYSLFFGVVWVVAVMKLFMLNLFISATGVKQIFGVRSYKAAAVGVAVVVAVGAMLIPDPHVGQQLVVNVVLVGVALSVGLLPLLGLLIILLRRRADKVAQSS